MLELVAVALSLGAILYHHGAVSLFVIGLLGCSFVVLATFLFRSGRGILFGLIIGSSLVVGGFAIQQATIEVSESLFGNRAFDATVLTVERRFDRTRITVVDELYHQNIQLFLYDDLAAVLPGDRVSVRARIEHPEPFLTDTDRLFDYPNYLKSKNIVAIGKNAQIIMQEKGSASLERIATTVRFKVAALFSQYIAFPVDGIVAGMLLGYQGGIPDELQELFRTTGVLHVLVLSGYNITLLAGFLSILFVRVPFRLRTLLILFSVVALVCVSGSGVASVRAGIMGGIALVAGLSIRTYRPLRALTIAYLFFFVLSPFTLFYDPGFHLSFIATGVMLFVVPKATSFFAWIPQTRFIAFRELVVLAFLMPVATIPYIMYFSGLFPLVSPVANMLLAVAVPPLMMLGVLVMVGSVVAPLAHFFGAVSGLIGGGILSILNWFDRFPLWHTPSLPWWVVLGTYTLCTLFLFRNELNGYRLQLQSLLAPAPNSFDP